MTNLQERQRQRKRNGKTCHHGKELFLRKEELKRSRRTRRWLR
ncbi:hypothetical protein GBAR_LOCUS14741 [Geodia barretti]|uniref:Uncharacterized protein n=1 Tax=Geodia barretti TaxID=519541 RepID=A0AA35S8P0_GEOBA|nr:hypothetical protein GBAR_LOCUS14741 [Geodia barretti]